jgi:hypothetical protein
MEESICGIIIFLAIILVFFILIKISNHNSEKNEKFACHDYLGNDKYEYESLLRTDEWKRKRKEILERDGNRCKWCGSSNNLQIHHRYYEKYPNGKKVKPWDYPNEALITLCDECHKKAHEKYKIKSYYRKYKKHYN